MSRFIPREDVQRLTKRRKFSAQRSALQRLGIKFFVAADGEPLVDEAALDPAAKPQKARPGPRWDLLNRPPTRQLPEKERTR